ncbi:MAG: hypothetical protein QOG09_96 [Solirubrobacterales bacterium]|jgi:hypothetical protein|nr:hypothetical protein [Solirubrobacterales bacterium]MDX6651768.1 hypothetical protein [Solirubrobacterales bacterium]MDX6661994.1 hypothetical protein [Solirubrobacterales bacterium]
MHDDPTRRMDVPAGRGPYEPEPPFEEEGLPSGIKFLIGALLAVILGLIIGVIAVAGPSDDGGKHRPRTTITRTRTETVTQPATQAVTETTTVTQTVTQTQDHTVTQTVTVPPPGP